MMVDFYEPRTTSYEPRLFPRTHMRLCRVRFMIVLRPRAIRHKFRLGTGFTAGRLLGVPYGIAVRRWKRTRSQLTKITRPAALCVGAAWEAFLACQVPIDGRRRTVAKTDSSGWRPAARYRYIPFGLIVSFYDLRAICHGHGYSRNSNGRATCTPLRYRIQAMRLAKYGKR